MLKMATQLAIIILTILQWLRCTYLTLALIPHTRFRHVYDIYSVDIVVAPRLAPNRPLYSCMGR